MRPTLGVSFIHQSGNVCMKKPRPPVSCDGIPAPSLRASSPPLGGSAPSPRTSSSARAPAVSSAHAPDAAAVDEKHTASKTGE